MLLHDSKMNGIAGRELSVPKDDLLGAFKNRSIYGKDFVNDLQEGVKGTLNLMVSVHGAIPVQNLL